MKLYENSINLPDLNTPTFMSRKLTQQPNSPRPQSMLSVLGYADTILWAEYFARYFVSGSKIIHSNGKNPTFFLFTRCWPIAFLLNYVGQFFEREFFPPICSKFAVEYDWTIKISQNVQNLFFFVEKLMGFSEKTWKLFKIANCSKLFVECISTLFLRVFWLKIRTFQKLEKNLKKR